MGLSGSLMCLGIPVLIDDVCSELDTLIYNLFEKLGSCDDFLVKHCDLILYK